MARANSIAELRSNGAYLSIYRDYYELRNCFAQHNLSVCRNETCELSLFNVSVLRLSIFKSLVCLFSPLLKGVHLMLLQGNPHDLWIKFDMPGETFELHLTMNKYA